VRLRRAARREPRPPKVVALRPCGRAKLLLSRIACCAFASCGSAGASPSQGGSVASQWEGEAPAEPYSSLCVCVLRLGGSLALPRVAGSAGALPSRGRRLGGGLALRGGSRHGAAVAR
jgi:hypothetical protein